MSVQNILPLGERLSAYPLGKWLFSYLIRFFNPYTGSLGATVHPIALCNLGEFTSGMAVLASLDGDVRGIVRHISAEYFKKARGKLRAVCKCEIPKIIKDQEFSVHTDIFDSHDILVSRVDLMWQLGLRK